MLIRLLVVAVLTVAMAHGVDADATPSKLSDDVVLARLQLAQTSVQALELQHGETVPAERLAPQLAELDAIIAGAEHPLGEAALRARLIRSQLFLMIGKGAACEAELKDVIAGGGAANGITAAYQLLAMHYEQAGGRDADLIALAASADKSPGIDPQILGLLHDLAIQAALIPGTPFVDIAFVDLGGAKHELAEYRGKILLIDVWATWCPQCVSDLPRLQAIHATYHAQGFEVVGISLDQDRAALDRFLESRRITWTQSFDGKGWDNAIARRLGIHKLPATFLVDAEGNVIAKDFTSGDELEHAVKTAVEKLSKPSK